uniref:FNIP repeat-containing protein n=1 Tax=viral metagenome TaxID=1070528 RepID=A0A6C0CDC6_9ZZZZ
MACTFMDQLKFVFTYIEKRRVNKIVNLPYYDNFENILTTYHDTSLYNFSIDDDFYLSRAIRCNDLLCLLNKGRLPNKIKHHYFDTNKININVSDLKSHHEKNIPFNESINVSYPNNIISLKCIPFNITHLTISELRDEVVDDLPNTITHLFFGEYFDSKILSLPKSVIHIDFGERFNQSIDGLLPGSLTYLEFGFDFNKPIEYLPQTITHLILGESFNQPINCIPNSVVHLKFGCEFNQFLDDLPLSIKYLELGMEYNQSIMNCLSVTHIALNGYAIGIPYSVTHLRFRSEFKFNRIVKTYIPPTVTHLYLKKIKEKMFQFIPQSVRCLFIGASSKNIERYKSIKNKTLPNISYFFINNVLIE